MKTSTIDKTLKGHSLEQIVFSSFEGLDLEADIMLTLIDEVIEEMINEQNKRKEAYRKFLQILWNKQAPNDIFEYWLNVCLKEEVI